MPRVNEIFANFVGGEITPAARARIDIPLYKKAVARCENFIVMTQGGLRFRNGTNFVKNSRNNNKAWFIPFEFNDQQAYMIELTNLAMRFYMIPPNGGAPGAVLENAQNIGGVSIANPVTITLNAHGYANGDEIYITGTGTPLDAGFYLVANVTTNNFTLTDIFGNPISSIGYTYSGGGTAARVYTVTTPYLEADIPVLQFAQSADTMYIVNQNYAPMKLKRTGNASWTLATFARTGTDPFAPATFAISAASQAKPCTITVAATTGMTNGDYVSISGVVGMTQLNGQIFQINNVTGTTFQLYDRNGNPIDSTGYGAWTSGGTVTELNKYPATVGLLDSGRILYGNTRLNPATVWGSSAPSTGNLNLDDFTTGTNATNSFAYTLVPIHGKVDAIEWIASTSKFLMLGCFGTVRLCYGSTETLPVDAQNFNAKSVDNYGCARTIPMSTGFNLFYIQRGSRIVRSMQYDIMTDSYVTQDVTMVADHLTPSLLYRFVQQQSVPDDYFWTVRGDGHLNCLTFKQQENVSGWHQHYLGGQSVDNNGLTRNWGKVNDVGVLTRVVNGDQVWFAVERVINGVTVRSIEYMADQPVFPLRDDYFTGSDNEAIDSQNYNNYLYEVQKQAIHLDMCTTYDGSQLSSATMTPSATTGNAITLTASSAFFTAAMVGQEVRKKYNADGSGGGRAQITAIIDSTHATAQTLVNFDNTNTIAAGNWYLTAQTITGLSLWNGATVQVVADGGPHNDCVVANGQIVLDGQHSVVHVGFGYIGTVLSLNLDTPTQTGPGAGKKRTIADIIWKLLNSLGLYFGSSLYSSKRLVFRKFSNTGDRPTPLFNGMKKQKYMDDWSGVADEKIEKRWVAQQTLPMPCVILSTDVFMEINDAA